MATISARNQGAKQTENAPDLSEVWRLAQSAAVPVVVLVVVVLLVLVVMVIVVVVVLAIV